MYMENYDEGLTNLQHSLILLAPNGDLGYNYFMFNFMKFTVFWLELIDILNTKFEQ